MKKRKQFLTSLGLTGVALGYAAAAGAQSAVPSPAAPETLSSAPPLHSPSPSPKLPSDTAKSLATSMRKFDPSLTDAQIADIAENIDGNLGAGKTLNAKGRALKNSDEPVTEFRLAP